MFGPDAKDLAHALSEMERESRSKTNFDQVEQKNVFRSYLQADRRFDGFDADRLIERVKEARYNGRTLDLDDPFLMKNGQKRPLSW
jgi:hypothetical protein